MDGYAVQEVTRAATAFTRMPLRYSFAEAATLPCAGVTAWRALMTRTPVKAGDTVLVQGTRVDLRAATCKGGGRRGDRDIVFR